MVFYFILLGIFIVAMIYSGLADRNATQYTHADFAKWLEEGKVTAVAVTPNEEVPTGRVRVEMTDHEIREFQFSDINQIVAEAEAAGVTVIVTKVDKKQEEKKPEKKEEKKKPEEPKKTAKELREERIKKMRESAKTVNKKVTIEVKNAPSGDGRTTKKTLTDAQIRDLLNQGYKPGTSEQLASSEMQRCLSLIQMAIKDKWDKMAPKIGNNGTVLLSVQFNSSGGLVNVRLAKSCGDRLSDDAALSVARSVSSIPGLSQEFISQFRREPLTVRYYVSNR